MLLLPLIQTSAEFPCQSFVWRDDNVIAWQPLPVIRNFDERIYHPKKCNSGMRANFASAVLKL